MAQGTVEITGLAEQRKHLEQLLTDNPDMKRRLQGCIRKILMEARSRLSKEAQSGLEMQADPRRAYKAIRSAVYRRILGGQVNILSPRRASGGGKSSYEPPRNPSKRGGNRRPRSQRTQDMMGYEGSQRGFVLRFLNQGTQPRYSGYGRNGNNAREREIYQKHHADGRGNRGSISARNWFGGASHQQLEKASESLQQLIDRVLNEEFK